MQLGYGARQRRILAAETDRTGAVAEAIAQDKELTRSLLRSMGVPVSEGRPVADAEDAWTAAQEIGAAVVVKPQLRQPGPRRHDEPHDPRTSDCRLQRRPRGNSLGHGRTFRPRRRLSLVGRWRSRWSRRLAASRRRCWATAARRSASWSTRSIAIRAAATIMPPSCQKIKLDSVA